VLDESRMKYDLTTKCEFLSAIEIETFNIFENAEPSMNSTFRGISIVVTGQPKNALD
jgi:hypothetical protein